MKTARMMKRALCLTLLLIMTLMIFTPALASSKKNYYVNVKSLYVRSGPSSYHSAIDKLKKGDVVTKISSKNGWYYVKYSGGSGYVYPKYLSSVKTSGSSSSVSTGATYKTTANLYVRSKASTEGSILTKLKKGKKVTVKKTSGSWVYISYSGGSGWVAAKYLKRV